MDLLKDTLWSLKNSFQILLKKVGSLSLVIVLGSLCDLKKLSN